MISEETRKKISDANTGEKNPNFGKPRSEETKRKISLSNTGKTPSEETRRKLSIARKGRVITKETRMKLSIAGKGRIITEETRSKLRDAQIGDKSYMFGKTLNNTTCEKISAALTGITRSPETIKRMSESKMGDKNPNFNKSPSKETLEKRIKSNTGKIRTLESCKRISESLLGKLFSEDRCIKISMGHQGITNREDWEGYVKEQSYCGIFTPEFKMRQYEVTGYKCLMCGEILDHPECHHVYWQKSSCCQNVDEIGELYFNIFGEKVNPEILLISDKEKELEYGLNKFATLCSSCHGKVKGSKNGKSRIDYIREIENIINTQYNGRSYYTKEEYWGNGYYHKQDGVEKFHDAITGELYGKYLKGFTGWGLPKKR